MKKIKKIMMALITKVKIMMMTMITKIRIMVTITENKNNSNDNNAATQVTIKTKK